MQIAGVLTVLAFPFLVLAQTNITLYEVVATSGGVKGGISYDISIGGVNSQGQTTFIEDIIQSVAYGYPTSGTRVMSVPVSTQTLHATLVQDATVQLLTELPSSTGDIGVIQSCSLGSSGKSGVCVDQIWLEGGNTFTTTYTGIVVPYYTLAIPPTTSATSTTSASSNNSNDSTKYKTSGVAMISSLFVFFLGW